MSNVPEAIMMHRPLNARPATIRPAFTLAEMLVVLVIMAVVTTVAVQSLTPVQNQARFEATQRTLTNVNAAIVSSNQSGGGASTVSGFIADVGGPPLSPDGTTSPLAELILNTSGLPLYTTYLAASPDADIAIPCGWRGPYVKPPVGGSALDIIDGWGQSLLTANPPATFFPSSQLTGPLFITSIANAASGMSAVSFALNQYDMQATQITGKLFGLDTTTNLHAQLTATEWTVTLFVPNPYPTGDTTLGIPAASTQPILGIPAKISSSGADVTYSFIFNSASPLSLSSTAPNWPLWVGPRVLRARFGGAAVTGTTYYTPKGTDPGVGAQGAVYVNLSPGASHTLGDILVLKK
jgi:prepilin-type N-terminal cleavage/methylation domain-containing protein